MPNHEAGASKAVSSFMNAMVLTGHGDLDKLEYRADMPKPVPADTEVLVRVGACGLNNTDVNTRTAWYSKGVSDATTGAAFDGATDEDSAWGGNQIQFPRIQGADVCGVAEAVGSGADKALIGKRVMIDPWLLDSNEPENLEKSRYFGSETNGGYAEYTCVDHRNVHPVSSSCSDAELATFATSYITAENMLNRAHVCADDTVLIPGASGGVGSALVQLANRRGATTVAMCSDQKAAQVRAIGAHHVMPRSTPDLGAVLARATGRDTVDVVADVVGGEHWPGLLDCIARGGCYTCAGAIAGPIVQFDLRTFYLRNLVLTGATIVPKGVFADLVGYIEREEIKPLLAQTFALRDLVAAQTAFLAKNHVGNIVVVP